MKKFVPSTFSVGAGLLIAAVTLYILTSEIKITQLEPEQNPLTVDERRELSEGLANIFWANLNNYYPYYDIKTVLSHLENLSKQGSDTSNSLEGNMAHLLPLLNKINDYETAQNLEESEIFLTNLKKKEGIVEVVDGKLYFEKLESGEGPTLTINDSPLLSYSELDFKLSNKPCFSRDIKVSLVDTIQGFAQGVVGMRIGERRKIYVHPDLAYGKHSREKPGELVIFDVKAISK